MSDARARRCSQVLAAALLACAAWLPALAQPAAALPSASGPDSSAPVVTPSWPSATTTGDAEAPAVPASSGSASAAQWAEVRRTLEALRSTDADRQAETSRLHEQVAALRAQVEWHERVLPWMGAALALLAIVLGLVVWRPLRLSAALAPRAAARTAADTEAMAPASEPAAAHPDASSHVAITSPLSPSATLPPGRPVPAVAPGVFDRSMLERPEFVSSTRPVPQLFTAPMALPPALSADALIDLEQQADFFLALGQDEAAVERLLAELRTVEGRSPMPWLKLLEIHRRQDDVTAYQRALERFRQRFDLRTPEWAEPDRVTRRLDDYPEAMGPLQQAWPTPERATVLLERLLGGCEAGLVLSMPASQDALLLYQIARSFLPNAPAPASDVDLLLPMEVAAAAAATAETSAAGTPARRSRLDLDLSSDMSPLR